MISGATDASTRASIMTVLATNVITLGLATNRLGVGAGVSYTKASHADLARISYIPTLMPH